jgi:hypothetical protein
MIGSIAVVVVNFILTQLMDFLSLFEKHHSLNNKSLSTAFKLFIMQFINTSLLMLLINNENADIFEYPNWYESVGKSIMYSMVFNIVTPHIFQLLKSYCLEQKGSFTSSFNFSEKYASLYSTIFSCCMFSLGYPVMYPILAASLFVRYWIDLILFKKQIEKNMDVPVYTIEMQHTFSNTLPFAWLFHLCIGTCMLLVKRGTDITELIYLDLEYFSNLVHKENENVLILFTSISFASLLVISFLYYLINDSILHCISCGYHRRKQRRQDRKLDLSNMLTYTMALERGIVSTYSILEMPKYKHTLRDLIAFVRELKEKTKDFDDEKEDFDEKNQQNENKKKNDEKNVNFIHATILMHFSSCFEHLSNPRLIRCFE